MSKYPYMTVFHCRLLISALGVIGILLTASCLVLIGYSYCMPPSPSDEPPVPLPVLPPLGVVGVVVWLPLLPLLLSLLASSVGVLASDVVDFTASTRLMVVSRLDAFSSPVALARRRRPSMYFATVKSSLVGAPSFTLRPMEKMARSGNLTFLPSRRSSLVQTTASVKIPLMAPLEKGVLWLAMCSANSSRPMVSSVTTRGYHFWYALLSLLLF